MKQFEIRDTARGMALNALTIAVSTAVYGAVLAAWRSPLMSAYVAAKLPVVFLGSTLVVSAFCWMAGLLTGANLRYREVVAAVFTAMSVAGSILVALAPVALYFILSGAPDEGTADEMRFVHATMMLVHILVFSTAGVIGVVSLYRALRRRVPQSCNLALTLALWLAAFAIVGCQLGWMARPLVGSPNISVEFLRADALDSNFLESVSRQIIPHIIHKGAIR